MAKFRITFVARDDEEVAADFFSDKPPFIDFERWHGQDRMVVVRYRADDIEKIERED